MENTVAHVATWIIAALRTQTFATLAELKAAVSGQLEAYNAEPFGEAGRLAGQRVHLGGEGVAAAAAGHWVRDQSLGLRSKGWAQRPRVVRP